MKFIKKLFSFILFLAIALVLILGYLGFVPGVSRLMGSDKPRDLGVAAAAEDLTSIEGKLKVEYLESGNFQISGSQPFTGNFTDKELTALVNSHFAKWRAYPVSQAQVKFNADGTAEVSGILHLDRLPEYATATGIAVEDLKEAIGKFGWLSSNPPFYLKGRAEIKNGQLTGSLEKLQIGRLSVPLQRFGADTPEVSEFASNRLRSAGVGANTAIIKDGQADFSGTFPTKVTFPR